DALLEPLQLLARELDDLPAALADDVVVRRIALDGLEARLAVVEVPLGGEPHLLEQLERPVHGCVPDARVHLADRPVELVDREVALGAEEDARDVVSLRRRLEPPLAQRLLELPHPRARGHPPATRYGRATGRRASSNRRSAGDT